MSVLSEKCVVGPLHSHQKELESDIDDAPEDEAFWGDACVQARIDYRQTLELLIKVSSRASSRLRISSHLQSLHSGGG